MSLDNYKYIIKKIKLYTREIYLHILGEPLLHPDIIKFIEYGNEEGLLVNVTTNGYLINNLFKVFRLNILT